MLKLGFYRSYPNGCIYYYEVLRYLACEMMNKSLSKEYGQCKENVADKQWNWNWNLKNA